jgi:hypothetical protein
MQGNSRVIIIISLTRYVMQPTIHVFHNFLVSVSINYFTMIFIKFDKCNVGHVDYVRLIITRELPCSKHMI